MNIILPTISPEIMKKYPLYVLIAFLSAIGGYAINASSNSQKQIIQFLAVDNKRLKRMVDSLDKANSDFKDALLIQNGIIKEYRTIDYKDSLTNKKIKHSAIQLLKTVK